MKPPLILLTLALPVSAQGPLAPSTTVNPATGPIAPLTSGGVPQPLMKTLHQVEPRTPVISGSPGITYNSSNGGFTITAAGSYYLTANITVSTGDAIAITARGVALDLNGFNISSTANPPTGNGIIISPSGAASITNGSIHSLGSTSSTTESLNGSGFHTGILVQSSHAQVSRVRVSGASSWGIDIPPASGSLVESCTVRECANGIRAGHVSNCTAGNISSIGIFADLVNFCHSSSYLGTGISAPVVNNSFGRAMNTLPSYGGIGILSDPWGRGVVTNSRGVTGVTSTPSSAKSIWSAIAIGCGTVGESNIVYRYNMPATP